MTMVSILKMIAYNRTNHAKPFTPSSAWSRGRLSPKIPQAPAPPATGRAKTAGTAEPQPRWASVDDQQTKREVLFLLLGTILVQLPVATVAFMIMR